mmetsp:Transcript_42020/g.108287  ORF Transcript_42020/g.108287 Transcript_42020/m.108287 type:complete len:210 (-) Transcript_42020:70-699(-)
MMNGTRRDQNDDLHLTSMWSCNVVHKKRRSNHVQRQSSLQLPAHRISHHTMAQAPPKGAASEKSALKSPCSKRFPSKLTLFFAPNFTVVRSNGSCVQRGSKLTSSRSTLGTIVVEATGGGASLLGACVSSSRPVALHTSPKNKCWMAPNKLLNCSSEQGRQSWQRYQLHARQSMTCSPARIHLRHPSQAPARAVHRVSSWPPGQMVAFL